MARLESVVKQGFYPLPDGAMIALAKLFKPADFKGGRLLDATAGEGVAADYLSKAWNLTPYTNEYDFSRAAKCVEKFGKMQAVRGDFFTLFASYKAFAVNFHNPPFMQSRDVYAERGSIRSEHQFLSHAWKYTARNGYLVFVCYTQHLTLELLNEMHMQSEKVDIYRVPGLDLGSHSMVISVCKMKATPGMLKRDEKAAAEMYERVEKIYALHLKMRDDMTYRPSDEEMSVLFEDITTVTEPRYEIQPTVMNRYNKFEFHPQDLPPQLAKELAQDFGPHKLPAFDKYMTPAPDDRMIQPPMPVRNRQLFSLIASGLLNGLMLEEEDGSRTLVRSVTRQVEKAVDDGQKADKAAGVERDDYDEEEPEETVTKYITAPETTITILGEHGEVKNISKDADLNGFIKDHRKQIMAYVEVNFRSLYNFDYVGGLLTKFLKGLTLKKEETNQVFNLLTTQKHVVSGMYAKLSQDKAVILCGQMGVGKTVMAASLMESMRYREVGDAHYNIYEAIPVESRMRDDQFNILVCPPHLVSKHEREIMSISPDAYIGVIRSGEGIKPIVAAMDFIRGMATAAKNSLKVLIISREMVKVGDGWEAAYVEKKVKNHFTGDMEISLRDPVTFREILEPTKSRTNPPKPIPVARLEKKRTYMNLKPSVKDFARPKRGNKGRTHKFQARHNDVKRAETYVTRGMETYAKEIIDGISVSRRQHDAAQPNHGALWQEARTFSALPHNPRKVLQERMGARVPVIPFPDLVKQHMTPAEYIPSKSPRGPLEGIAKFLANYYGDSIYMLLADECQDYMEESAQGYALQVMASKASKLVLMTGTLYKGVASGMYLLEFIANPRMRFMYPWGKGRADWVAQMGVLERIVKVKKEVDGKNTGRTARSETVKEVPGASPELLKEIIDHTIFVGIRDMGKALPEFNETGVPVEMDAQMTELYRRVEGTLKSYLLERKGLGDAASFLGTYFNTLLNFPNYPFDDLEVWHNRTVMDKKTEVESVVPFLVMTIPGFGHDYVTPKEKLLIERVKAEREAGRGVAVYFRQTGQPINNPTKNMLKRINDLLKLHVPGVKPAILESKKVSTGKREEWLTKQKNAGVNVLLCNANLVKTGLDLLEYPTILWFELDFSLTTMDQASHRSWRLGQEQVCDVDYLFYVQGSGQDDAEISFGDDDQDFEMNGPEDAAQTLAKMFREGGHTDVEVSYDANGTDWVLYSGDTVMTDSKETIAVIDDSGEEYEGDEAPVRSGFIASTMEAKGVVLMEKKRGAAAFIYGEESASLSGMSDAGGSLKDMLADNLDAEMAFDISSMFKKAAVTELEMDEYATEPEEIEEVIEIEAQNAAFQEEIVVEVVAEPEPVVTAVSHYGELLAKYEEEHGEVEPEPVVKEVAAPVNEIAVNLVKSEAERTAHWQKDVKDHGQPKIVEADKAAWFKVKGQKNKFICWIKTESEEYVRQSLIGEQVVFAVKFQGKSQQAVA